jgi:hypothetical protein
VADTPRPKRSIRRFDVFAEYNKLKALAEGRPLDEAKGYGLWVAKVVASRRFGPRLTPVRPRDGDRGGPGRGDGTEREDHAGQAPPAERERFKSVGDEIQTDALFDREIVERMGEEFYRVVFSPTIARHVDRGDDYEAIRDTIRRDWKAGR